MTFDWQNIAALVLVAAAAIYAVRWICRSVCEKNSGCGGCSSKNEPQPAVRQIVSVEDLSKSGNDDRSA